MSSAPTTEEIARDATWLAQALDPAQGMVRLVAMDVESYRTASFLDDRMLGSPIDAQVVPWTLIEQAMSEGLRSDARWIFHIGHVGSTLVSRLLGEIAGVLAIREPRFLRDIALTPADVRARYARPVPRLMSRTFRKSEIACVKATSFVSEVAPELVPEGERALFIYARPRQYVAGILSGENSIRELHALAPSRTARMAERVGLLHGQDASDASLAAAAWACEMTGLEKAAEQMGDRHVAWADFDQMLENMALELARVANFFGFSSNEDAIDAILNGETMQRYSKAPEYHYSPALRQQLIGETGARFNRQIDTALAMLERAAEDSPLLMRALSRAKES
jgi:hypothetical protein